MASSKPIPDRSWHPAYHLLWPMLAFCNYLCRRTLAVLASSRSGRPTWYVVQLQNGDIDGSPSGPERCACCSTVPVVCVHVHRVGLPKLRYVASFRVVFLGSLDMSTLFYLSPASVSASRTAPFSLCTPHQTQYQPHHHYGKRQTTKIHTDNPPPPPPRCRTTSTAASRADKHLHSKRHP